jgi:hypothetical protein
MSIGLDIKAVVSPSLLKRGVVNVTALDALRAQTAARGRREASCARLGGRRCRQARSRRVRTPSRDQLRVRLGRRPGDRCSTRDAPSVVERVAASRRGIAWT